LKTTSLATTRQHLISRRGAGWTRAAAAARVICGAAAAMLAVAALLTSACSGGANGEGEFGQQGEVPVLVAKVERKSIAEKLHAIGRVDPFQRIDVKAQVGGELVEVHFSEGDYVRKGDLLLTIDPRPYRAAFRQAQADLMRNEAQLAQAQADEKRFEFLLKEGVGSQQQFDQAHAQAESLRAALAASRAAVEVAKLNLS
jgi:multidrug efflux system membrane fusion protein